jgi:hypothetical protein
MARRGSLLVEAIVALFLLGVAGMAVLALLGHSLATFELAESRGRAMAPAASWLEVPPAEPTRFPVGAGVLEWDAEAEVGLRYLHPRGGSWPLLGPPPGAP